ncbi:hypothetical protein PRO82_000099 [Candidatus Protochlamydia amoebophila]|nr:hypothetical protein [Candidatus Protochlamydia amoebophila]
MVFINKNNFSLLGVFALSIAKVKQLLEACDFEKLIN